MDPLLTVAEKRKAYRSLLVLIKALENTLTTIDLRNESSASGVITYVDGHMNITMENAALVENDSGDYKYFSSLFLPARMIRDVIIPESIDITGAIYALLPSKPAPKPTKSVQKMSFKKKRAANYQRENLGLLKTALEAKSRALKEK